MKGKAILDRSNTSTKVRSKGFVPSLNNEAEGFQSLEFYVWLVDSKSFLKEILLRKDQKEILR